MHGDVVESQRKVPTRSVAAPQRILESRNVTLCAPFEHTLGCSRGLGRPPCSPCAVQQFALGYCLLPDDDFWIDGIPVDRYGVTIPDAVVRMDLRARTPRMYAASPENPLLKRRGSFEDHPALFNLASTLPVDFLVSAQRNISRFRVYNGRKTRFGCDRHLNCLSWLGTRCSRQNSCCCCHVASF